MQLTGTGREVATLQQLPIGRGFELTSFRDLLTGIGKANVQRWPDQFMMDTGWEG